MKTIDYDGDGALESKVNFKVVEGVGIVIDAGASGKLAVNFKYMKQLLNNLSGAMEVYGEKY